MTRRPWLPSTRLLLRPDPPARAARSGTGCRTRAGHSGGATGPAGAAGIPAGRSRCRWDTRRSRSSSSGVPTCAASAAAASNLSAAARSARGRVAGERAPADRHGADAVDGASEGRATGAWRSGVATGPGRHHPEPPAPPVPPVAPELSGGGAPSPPWPPMPPYSTVEPGAAVAPGTASSRVAAEVRVRDVQRARVVDGSPVRGTSCSTLSAVATCSSRAAGTSGRAVRPRAARPTGPPVPAISARCHRSRPWLHHLRCCRQFRFKVPATTSTAPPCGTLPGLSLRPRTRRTPIATPLTRRPGRARRTRHCHRSRWHPFPGHEAPLERQVPKGQGASRLGEESRDTPTGERDVEAISFDVRRAAAHGDRRGERDGAVEAEGNRPVCSHGRRQLRPRSGRR